MGKTEQRQIDRALSMRTVDARMSAASLATIQRSANRKTSAEVAAIIESHPDLVAHLSVVNGCYVPRAAL